MADNPFAYGHVVTGAAFTDREAELAQLVDDLRSGQNVTLISPRRYGKTSLIEVAIAQARAAGVRVAYVDLFTVSSKERLVVHLAQTITRDLLSATQRDARRLRSFFGALPRQPTFTVGDDGSMRVTLSRGAAADLDDTLEGLLQLPGQIAVEENARVALVLDEFQEVTEISPELPRVLRAIFQRQGDVAHVFLGSHKHVMDRLFASDQQQPLFRSARVMRLGRIPRHKWVYFLTGRCAATGITIREDAAYRILDRTECLSYETQEVAHDAWAIAAARDGVLDVDVAEEAWASALATNSVVCKQIWDKLRGFRQRHLLVAIAREPGARIYSADLRAEYDLGSASAVQAAATKLRDEQLVDDRDDGGLYVPDVFLRAWLQAVWEPGTERG